MVPQGEGTLVILGPTGAGKTSLGVEVASIIGGHILSADSRQIYKLMDIGTAKPTKEERERAPHHLIDLVFPDQPFSVADFQKVGREKIAELERMGIPYLIVGGSPFYLYALMGSFFFPTVGADPQLRMALEKEAREKGSLFLHQRLQNVDPVSASRIHFNDLKRIIRALEVWELTGKPLSSFSYRKMEVEGFRLLGLKVQREDLRKRLERRTEAMFESGLVEEVKSLLEGGFGPDLMPMQSIGYREVIEMLNGKLSLKEAKDLIVQRSLQFAKRQMTWFKRDPRISWIEIPESPDFGRIAKSLVRGRIWLF